MTFRMAVTGLALALALALAPGLAIAQSRTLAVADLIDVSVETADTAFDGALRPAWAGLDGTVVYLAKPGRCRLMHDGETIPVALLARHGRVEAVLRRSGPTIAFNRERQPYLSPSDDPLAPAPGRLPMDDGLAATRARLASLALPAEAEVQIQCSDRAPAPAPAAARPSEGLQALAALPGNAVAAVWFAPVWLFGVPAENRSRAIGATEGPLALSEVVLGEPLAGGAVGFRDRRRSVVRLHAGSGDYSVVSIDLGGPPGRGVSLPREVVFVGVRGGVVEWIGDRSGGIGQSLCTRPTGRFGGREGCSTTGYYSPRI